MKKPIVDSVESEPRFKWDINSLLRKSPENYVGQSVPNVESKPEYASAPTGATQKRIEDKVNFRAPSETALPVQDITPTSSIPKMDVISMSQSAPASNVIAKPLEPPKEESKSGIPWSDLIVGAIPALLGAATGSLKEGADAGLYGMKQKQELDKNDYSKAKDAYDRRLKQMMLDAKTAESNKKKYSFGSGTKDGVSVQLAQDTGTGEVKETGYGGKPIPAPKSEGSNAPVRAQVITKVPKDWNATHPDNQLANNQPYTFSGKEFEEFKSQGGQAKERPVPPTIITDPYGNMGVMNRESGAYKKTIEGGLGEQKLPSSGESYNPPKVVREKQIAASQKFDQHAKPYHDVLVKMQQAYQNADKQQLGSKIAISGLMKQAEGGRMTDADREYYIRPVGAIEGLKVKLNQMKDDEINPELLKEAKDILRDSIDLSRKRIDEMAIQSASEVGTFAGDDKAFETTLNSIHPDLVKRKLESSKKNSEVNEKEKVGRAVQAVKDGKLIPNDNLKQKAKLYGFKL